MYNRRFTPERITQLADNEIFVFGSNIHGHHGGGAARLALERFGAVWGQGVGLQGRSMYLIDSDMNARIISAAVALAVMTAASAQTKDDGTVRRSGDTLIISTKVLGTDVIGFNDVTPLEVKILGGKVADIVALPNDDTPSFFGRAFETLKPKWLGKSVKEAAAVRPDAVSGATYSSKAIIRNVALALDAAAGR